MRLAVSADGILYNKEFRSLVSSPLPVGIRAIQWGERGDTGHIEYSNGEPNRILEDAEELNEYIHIWEQNPPPKIVETVDEFLTFPEWKKNRLRNYPMMSEYIDAVVKGDNTQMDEYIKKCQEVKSRFPKQ